MEYEIKKIYSRQRISEELRKGKDDYELSHVAKDIADDIISALIKGGFTSFQEAPVYDDKGNQLPYWDIVAEVRVARKKSK